MKKKVKYMLEIGWCPSDFCHVLHDAFFQRKNPSCNANPKLFCKAKSKLPYGVTASLFCFRNREMEIGSVYWQLPMAPGRPLWLSWGLLGSCRSVHHFDIKNSSACCVIFSIKTTELPNRLSLSLSDCSELSENIWLCILYQNWVSLPHHKGSVIFLPRRAQL